MKTLLLALCLSVVFFLRLAAEERPDTTFNSLGLPNTCLADSLLEAACRDDSFRYTRKHFWRAAGETVGFNIGLWAFDRYVQKGHFAYINLNTIKENFKHGFEWDNDHLATNMFAHPYNGSLFFNAGRSNGYNFWQSELFAIGGSAMWEMFMECEYPSTNDIIATPIGGAAIGEVLYRASDLVLDDRTTGWNRFAREFAAFVISPMRGFTRLVSGDSWKRRMIPGRHYGRPPLSIDVSVGTKFLLFHSGEGFFKAGGLARMSCRPTCPTTGSLLSLN